MGWSPVFKGVCQLPFSLPWQNILKSNVNKGGVTWSKFGGSFHHGGEIVEMGAWGVCSLWPVRKERRQCLCSPCFLPLSSLRPQPVEGCCPQLGWTFPSAHPGSLEMSVCTDSHLVPFCMKVGNTLWCRELAMWHCHYRNQRFFTS